ncbi:TetR/AcrR family transcriptional regulator [Rhizobium sp. TRM95796]|uniref:TetR/AcrR family transcriptional regulator n=1 Tax=Rhizobium sp. TRM95796 TaxID=2979862 RepID=UPI0021E86ED2|nr:TetR/AcrR family transcriptional regulator [Rhizobium sp. TRM95796]MCV3766890.1 TetR/AcrR family transcriptional regulator [Rhizobium sp. TRM95796]
MAETDTRGKIVAAANRLFYREGIRAVSVDAVAAEAGITKKSLYYHFKSKDDLVAAYLHYRDQPSLGAFQKRFEASKGALPERIAGLFDHLAVAAADPKWKGCGFLRTSVELANLPGHPAIVSGAAHKKRLEAWLQSVFDDAGLADAEALARQIRLLIDGCFAVVMLHRDPGYMREAGEAARCLVKASLAK